MMASFTAAISRGSLFLLLVVMMLSASSSEARRWEDAISVAIYAQSNVDIPRIQYSLEEDPINTAPTLAESQPPSDAPSSVPSFYDDSDGDGDDQSVIKCPNGESPYKVNKYDAWGDGWGETTLTIREVGEASDEDEILDSTLSIASDESQQTNKTNRPMRSSMFHRGLDYVLVGALKNGDVGSDYVCLSESACYEVTLHGGKWQEQAKWEILPVVADQPDSSYTQVAIAKGRGFSNCTFYTSEQPSNDPNCRFTCRPRHDEEEEQDGQKLASISNGVSGITNSTSFRTNGTSVPVIAKTNPPTPSPTVAPTGPTGAPSDAPSLVPTMPSS